MNNYIITKTGYGILKSILTDKEKEDLINELTVKPIVNEEFNYGKVEETIVYRESDLRLYVPKYFGLQKYGNAVNKEKDGEDASLNFNGTLKEHQVDFCNKILDSLNKDDSCIACSATGSGKCLAPGTLVLMYTGYLEKVENINIGDIVMGPDSKPRNVLSIGNGKEEMFEIIPRDNGKSYIINRSHILSLKNVYTKKIVNISVNDYLKKSLFFKFIHRGYRVPIDFKHFQKLPLDPYLLGYWLTSSKGSRIIVKHVKIVDYLLIKLIRYDCFMKFIDNYTYEIYENENDVSYFWHNIYKLNLFNNYVIPDIYKFNSRENRLKLLAGILDGESINNIDIDFLLKSLGFSLKGDTIYGQFVHDIPCLTKNYKFVKKDISMYKFSIVPKGTGKYYGFTIDGDHRFVLEDCTVTHNTAMSLWILCQLKKRTLILVHKDFLMNQWIERIKMFIPNASIGIIKQSQCEIRDITIGMIQSVTKRTYPKDTFSSFHITIFDECHHISSKVFSNALFIARSKKNLGLSATPTRPDGLTKILTWSLGKIITNHIESNIDKPIVEFVVAEYSKPISVTYNFKGQLNAPEAINKLVSDNTRNKQIIAKINELASTGRKILVLSGRRQHCSDLAKCIDKYSTGLYLGSMKNEDLVESNKANIIFATYSMASEGYDNPELDTLIMATGIGNIKQTVGRILRQKNKNKPLIVDFIDPTIFGGQANRRKQYYKINKFVIKDKEETYDTSECLF